MKNEYFISLADIKLRIRSETELEYFKTVISDFSYDQLLGYDITFDIILCDEDLCEQPHNTVPFSSCALCKIYMGEHGEIRVFKNSYFGGSDYIYISRCSATLYEMKMSRACAKRMEKSFRFMNMLCLENMLLDVNGLMLHSVVMEHNGSAILLTAPSGTGKSTHSRLWQRLYGVKIINGDKALIRKKGDTFYAYGSPMTGSSGIGINSCAPIKAIVSLSQAPNNTATPLNLKQAYTAIYSQSTVNVWSKDFVDKICDIILDMTSCVPVFRLDCNMEDNAAHTIYRTIFGTDTTFDDLPKN